MEMTAEKIIGDVEAHWPQVFSDAIARGRGLILFSGTRESQVSLLDSSVALKNPKSKVIGLDRLPVNGSLKDADIVIYRGPTDPASTLELINFAEEGRLVIQAVMSPSVVGSLHKVFSTLNQDKHLIWRFVDQLALVLTQMKIKDINERDFFVHEVMLTTPAIKKCLLSKDVESLESQLKENTEDQGMVSLNQNLLKLLIRRRIDLKTAFLMTRDPENLDQLLKRVGI